MTTISFVIQAATQAGLNYAADRRYVVLARKDDQNRQQIIDTKYDTESSVLAIVAKLV